MEEAPHTAPAQHAGRGSMPGALLQTHRCVFRVSSSGRVGRVTLLGMSQQASSYKTSWAANSRSKNQKHHRCQVLRLWREHRTLSPTQALPTRPLPLPLLPLSAAGCTAYAFCKDPAGCGTGCSAHVGKNPGGACAVLSVCAHLRVSVWGGGCRHGGTAAWLIWLKIPRIRHIVCFGRHSGRRPFLIRSSCPCPAHPTCHLYPHTPCLSTHACLQ